MPIALASVALTGDLDRATAGVPKRPATLHDLREFGRWFGEITATRIGHVVLSVAAIIDGIRRVADHSAWGILLIAAGMAALLVPAWIFYYGVPERDSSYRGKHSS